jgi:3-mercaptopyruvate sulfurtransferase SseA
MHLFPRHSVVARSTVAALGFSLLAACGGGGGDASPAPAPAPAPAPPAASLPPKVGVGQLTLVSADNYAHNRAGLIEASTLQTYVSNWATADTAAANLPPNGRPAYLPAGARLVVLQLNGANPATDLDYVPANPASNVFVYELDAFRFNAVRDTGLVSNSVRYQADGPTVDAWLARYGIDLNRDFVVLANGSGTGTPAGAFFQDLGRATYWLSYWGADARNLAIVNGTLEKNYTGALVSTKTADSTVSGAGSVRAVRRDQTGITVPFEDVLAIVDAGLRAANVVPGFTQQVIVDARPAAQFNRTAVGSFNDTVPGQFITTAWNSAGAPSNDAAGRAKNYVLYEGHIKGAVAFPWVALLEDVAGDGNVKFKSKSALQTLYTNAGYAPGDTASKVVVSQCRTNFEAQVNGFASRLILGYPTVFFDGSLVEYTSLTAEHPDAAFNLRATDPAFKYRTDTAARSQRWVAGSAGAPASTTRDDSGVTPYNIPNGSGPDDRKVAQAVINRNATTTRRALDADVEYKRQ